MEYLNGKKDIYERPKVVTIDGNSGANGVEAQPTGIVCKEQVAVAYAYAIALVSWTQIDITPWYK